MHDYICVDVLGLFPSGEGPTLETLDFTIRIGSTSTFFIFRFLSEHCLRRILR